MYITIKTLLEQGKSLRGIAEELSIDRKTVRRIKRQLDKGEVWPPLFVREKGLSPYGVEIERLYDEGFTAVLIHRELVSRGITISYPSVARWVEGLRDKEVYVPIHKLPGEEGQVDFGYCGYFDRHGEKVKVWVFCMVLSYSRHSFYTAVTDQKVATFIWCHIVAFEYFAGVPRTVKPDNLTSAITTPNLYEPVLQKQYAEFLISELLIPDR